MIAAFQPSHEFGRVLAADGGVFIVGSMLWGVVFDGFRPDRADILGALINPPSYALHRPSRRAWSRLAELARSPTALVTRLRPE